MKKYVICLLLILSVGIRGTETFAQRMSIICSNSTGAALDVTIVLKSPDGNSFSVSNLKHNAPDLRQRRCCEVPSGIEPL